MWCCPSRLRRNSLFRVAQFAVPYKFSWELCGCSAKYRFTVSQNLPGVVPMHHRQPRRGGAEIGNPLALKRANVDRLQIGTAKGDACHPWSNPLASGEQHLLIHLIIEKGLLQVVHLL